MFPEFIPIELRGMSILTALTFFFYTAGFTAYYHMIKREIKRINAELERHSDKIDDGHECMNALKTDTALLLQSVNRIEKMLEKERRD